MMSPTYQHAHETIDLGGTPEGSEAGYSNPQGEPINDSIDRSGPLFSMYLEMAMKADKEMTERWKTDTKGIILFTGLFSASLTAFLAVSIQDLRQNPPDTSAFYLANIYQLLAADLDVSHVSIPSTLSPPPSDVSVPKHAVWVNSLWFLSLIISIMCALSATFVQQWAHRYIKVTASEEPYSLYKQARIRAFFAEGVDRSRLPLVVELIPTFLHLSVFLFFAGLCVFLFNLNPAVFSAVVPCVGVCVLIYLCIIIMPTLRCDTPYHSPLSSLAWYLWTGMLYVFFIILWLFTLWKFCHCFFIRIRCFSYTTTERISHLRERYRKWFLDGVRKAAEESAQNLSPEIDGRALVATLRSLDGDDKQEQFFAKMSEALVGFLHRALSSNLDRKSFYHSPDLLPYFPSRLGWTLELCRIRTLSEDSQLQRATR
ncbi:hypothetical protein BJV78DRAFT_622655 [Lactifluus subvellereus]|nr:hypothetical protein BJV78DRAFT_622655 [Lactifluus subvellereus]